MNRLPVVLLLYISVGVYGRPARQTTTTNVKLLRNYKHITNDLTGGVTSNHNKRHSGVQTTINYLSKMKIFSKLSSLQRKDKAQAASSLDKFRFFLSRSQSNSEIKPSTGLADRCGGPNAGNSKLKTPTRFSRSLQRLRRRFRRYATQGSKWPSALTTITWSVTPNYWSSKMTNTEVKDTITKAFRAWAEVIPLVFRYVTDSTTAAIKIGFRKGYHGCQQYFDGPRGVLAHAYYPQYGGDIHFDDDEPWKPDTTDKNYKSLLKIAIHEIGHSLGLQHSDVSGAIMGKYYLSSSSNSLGDDDIKGIQSIYGRCEPANLDSVESSFVYGKTYMFKGDQYWKYDDLNNQAERPGYPRIGTKGWPGLPRKIDEMLMWRYNYGLYIFSGKYYYRYDEYLDRVADNYPRLISQGWKGVPDNIDAAVSIDHNYSYFFKGDTSYKYDNRLDQVIQVEKISTAWPLIPDNLDSAFAWYYNGFTYFFKGRYYWKWDTVNKRGLGPYRIKNDWKNLCGV